MGKKLLDLVMLYKEVCNGYISGSQERSFLSYLSFPFQLSEQTRPVCHAVTVVMIQASSPVARDRYMTDFAGGCAGMSAITLKNKSVAMVNQ